MITSRQNAAVKLLRSLHRRKARREKGLVLLEGPKSAAELLQASGKAELVLVAQERTAEPEIADFLRRFEAAGTRIETSSPEIMGYACSTETPQGIALAARWAPVPFDALVQEQAGESRHLLILDGLQDPGNVGTLLRTANAAGVAAVILTGHAADPANPKAVRAAAGALFRLPIIEEPDQEKVAHKLQNTGYRIIQAEARAGTANHAFDWPAKSALVLGNEGQGAPFDWAAHGADAVHIPLAGEAESLNVAAAGAILLFNLTANRVAQSP